VGGGVRESIRPTPTATTTRTTRTNCRPDSWPSPGSPGPQRHRGATPPAHLAPRHDRRRLLALIVACALLAGASFAVQRARPPDDDDSRRDRRPNRRPGGPGLLTFRGGPSRSYYGEGPAPSSPEVLWSYPGEGGGMCAESSVGSETRVWCGTGWTGQPSVFDRDGRTWVVFGAYDRHIHFVDYETGQDILPPFPTGDIIKGSVSIDGEGLLGDVMYVGAEKSQFHVVKLNRSTGADGLVQVAPELVFNTPGWDDELITALNTRQDDVSIENSVAYHEGIVYFANSLLPRSFSTPTCRNPSSSTTIEASMSSLDPRQPDNPLVCPSRTRVASGPRPRCTRTS